MSKQSIIYKIILILTTVITIASCSTTKLYDTRNHRQFEKKYKNYNPLVVDHFLQALKYKELGNIYAAIVEFQNAYRLEEDSYIQKEIAECYYLIKQYKEALTAINLALEEKENCNNKSLLLKLQIAQKLKNDSEIEHVIDSLIENNNTKIDYYYYKIEFLNRFKRYEDIISLLKTALEEDFDKKIKRDIYEKMGAFYIISKKYEDAKDSYLDYLEKYDNQDLIFLTKLNRINIFLKDLDDAIIVQKKITALDSTNSTNFNILFHLLNANDQAKEGKQELIKAIDKFEDNRELTFSLARLYVAENDTSKARASYLSLLQNDSSDIAIYNALGIMYDQAGSKETALEIYQQAYNQFPENHNLLNNYAYLLSELNKDLELALKLSLKAIKKAPETSSYLDTIGWIYYKLNKLEKAEKFIEEASAIVDDPNQQHIIYTHLGKIKFELKKYKEALECYKKAYFTNNDTIILEKINEIKKKIEENE